MNKEIISAFFKNSKILLRQHSPEILTGIGITGMITTTVLAVKATPKALRLIEEAKEYHFQNDEEYQEGLISRVDIVKSCWKCYVPAVITGAASIACLIGASSVNAKRNAALLAAYKIAETSLVDFKDKVVENLGEKKVHDIHDQISKDKMEQHPVSSSEIIVTGKGQTRCYDILFGRYFLSDIETIKKAVNEANRRMLLDQCISLNDFYDELNLDHVAVGDLVGWSLDYGYIDIYFSAQIADDGQPCIVLNHNVKPQYDFDKLL